MVTVSQLELNKKGSQSGLSITLNISNFLMVNELKCKIFWGRIKNSFYIKKIILHKLGCKLVAFVREGSTHLNQDVFLKYKL